MFCGSWIIVRILDQFWLENLNLRTIGKYLFQQKVFVRSHTSAAFFFFFGHHFKGTGTLSQSDLKHYHSFKGQSVNILLDKKNQSP